MNPENGQQPEWQNFNKYLRNNGVDECMVDVIALRDEGWGLSERIKEDKFNGYIVTPPEPISEVVAKIEFFQRKIGKKSKFTAFATRDYEEILMDGEVRITEKPNRLKMQDGVLYVIHRGVGNKEDFTAINRDGTFK